MNWMLGSVMVMATCVLGASTTWACEPEPVLPMYPHWQQELPTDAVLQITVTDEDVLQDIVVVDADDQAVALDVEVVYDRYGQLTPQQPLTPGAYTLSVPARGAEWGQGAFDRPFTVVDRLAEELGPFTPTFVVTEEFASENSCYPRGTLFGMEQHPYALVVYDDSGDENLVNFEDSASPYTLTWPVFVEAGQTQSLRFGAFDEKGRFTGWGDAVELTSNVPGLVDAGPDELDAGNTDAGNTDGGNSDRGNTDGGMATDEDRQASCTCMQSPAKAPAGALALWVAGLFARRRSRRVAAGS